MNCIDNDSPWLVCKSCAAAGQCAKLNARQRNRWEAAKLFFERMLAKAKFLNAKLMFDGSIIELDQVRIEDNRITVVFPSTTYLLFEANADFDHGLYDTIGEYRTEMKKRFRMIKEIAW